MNIEKDIDLASAGCVWYDDEMTESFWDSEYFNDTMSEYLKKSNRYLVFASGCRWDGSSGYKFANDYEGAVSRDYDITLYPVKVSKGKKVLVCNECSHDVPMGGTTIFVALTDKEYTKLSNSAFDEVEKFAWEMESAI